MFSKKQILTGVLPGDNLHDVKSYFLLQCKKNIISLSSAELAQRMIKVNEVISLLTLVLLNPDMSFIANSVDPDQLASEKANWSGSALFAIKYVNL